VGETESIVSTALSQFGLALSGYFTLRQVLPSVAADRADVVNPRRRPAPNLPTVTLHASKETYLLSHNL